MLTTRKLEAVASPALVEGFAPLFERNALYFASLKKDREAVVCSAVTFRGREEYLAWTLAWRRAHAAFVGRIRKCRVERKTAPDFWARDRANLERWQIRACCRLMQDIRAAAKVESARQREEYRQPAEA